MALPRKRRRRLPQGWSHGLDLHDYTDDSLLCLRACRPVESVAIVVTDDWPEQVPIGDAELRIIEGGLRHELDALFGSLP